MGSTFEVESSGLYQSVHVVTAKVAAIGQAGRVLLTETIRVAGLGPGHVGGSGQVPETHNGP